MSGSAKTKLGGRISRLGKTRPCVNSSPEPLTTGLVYSKNEHECGAEWVIMQMLYWDDYERIDGQWYFRRRLPCYWYATDLNKPPIGDMKMRWPGRAPYDGTFHDLFPSWSEFWAQRPDKDQLPEVAAPAPLEQFLRTMRRGTPPPKMRVR